MTLDDETREALGFASMWSELVKYGPAPMSKAERRVKQREWNRAYDARNVERRRQRQREQKRRKRAEAKHGRADRDR